VTSGNCSYRCEGLNQFADDITGTCVDDCLELQYPRRSTNTSEFGPRCEHVCTSGYLLNGECPSYCPDNFATDPVWRRCSNMCVNRCTTHPVWSPTLGPCHCPGCDAALGRPYYALDGGCHEMCSSGTLKLILDGVGTCVSQCPAGTYQGEDGRCESCHPSCNACANVTTCTSCNETLIPMNGTCPSCPHERPFVNISDTVNTCVDDCRFLARFNDHLNLACVDRCPTESGYYLDVTSGNCLYRCEGLNQFADDITGTCVDDCLELQYPRRSTNTSEFGPRCEHVCTSGYLLNGECRSFCPNNFATNPVWRRCSNMCVDRCTTHPIWSPTLGPCHCPGCEAALGRPYYALDGGCHETCPSGTFTLILDGVGTCISQCPAGTYQVDEQGCEYCDPSCSTCSDSSTTSCTACDATARYLTPNDRCEPYVLPGRTCDSAVYPSSEDCAHPCLGGVCCAAHVSGCESCATGTGKCSACEYSIAPRNGLCGPLIADVNVSAAPTAPPGFTLWGAVRSRARGRCQRSRSRRLEWSNAAVCLGRHRVGVNSLAGCGALDFFRRNNAEPAPAAAVELVPTEPLYLVVTYRR
jgi:hypothetical protein